MGMLCLLVFQENLYNEVYCQNLNYFLIWYKIELGFTVVISKIGYSSNIKPSVE